jgi:hypothetical protein
VAARRKRLSPGPPPDHGAPWWSAPRGSIPLLCERCGTELDIWTFDPAVGFRGSDRGRAVDRADLELDDGKVKHVGYRCGRCQADVVLYTPGIFEAWLAARREGRSSMRVGDGPLVGFYQGERVDDSAPLWESAPINPGGWLREVRYRVIVPGE